MFRVQCLVFRVISTPSAALVPPVSGGQSKDNDNEDEDEEGGTKTENPGAD